MPAGRPPKFVQDLQGSSLTFFGAVMLPERSGTFFHHPDRAALRATPSTSALRRHERYPSCSSRAPPIAPTEALARLAARAEIVALREWHLAAILERLGGMTGGRPDVMTRFEGLHARAAQDAVDLRDGFG